MARLRIALIGGTGPQGRGLAYRLALAGHHVVIGSRDAQRAVTTAGELAAGSDAMQIDGAANQESTEGADLVVVAVPYEAQESTVRGLRGLEGRIVVSCVNPLAFDKSGPHTIDVPEGSAAEQTQKLQPDARVVAAFHHLAAPSLLDGEEPHDETVLVVGDDVQAKQVVIDICPAVAARGGLDAGPLRNAKQLEEFTAVLISINRIHKANSGLAVTGL